MNVFKSVVLAGVLAMGLLTVGTSRAQALDNYYAVVNVRNPTDQTLNYQFRWGPNSPWQSYSVAPGAVMTHWYTYQFANQNSSPVPEIRFHYNPAELTPQYKDYSLQAFAAPFATADYGRSYTFKYLPGGGYLDLYDGF